MAAKRQRCCPVQGYSQSCITIVSDGPDSDIESDPQSIRRNDGSAIVIDDDDGSSTISISNTTVAMEVEDLESPVVVTSTPTPWTPVQPPCHYPDTMTLQELRLQVLATMNRNGHADTDTDTDSDTSDEGLSTVIPSDGGPNHDADTGSGDVDDDDDAADWYLSPRTMDDMEVFDAETANPDVSANGGGGGDGNVHGHGGHRGPVTPWSPPTPRNAPYTPLAHLLAHHLLYQCHSHAPLLHCWGECHSHAPLLNCWGK